MVFELQTADYRNIDKLTFNLGDEPIYGSKKMVDSVEWNDGKNKITVRSGFKPVSDVSMQSLIEDPTGGGTRPDTLVHVSTEEEEYIFSVRSYINGGRLTIWDDGSTNQHVYVFEGCVGQIMKVDYRTSYRPSPDFVSNTAMQTITEEFGQIALGRFKIPYDTTAVGTNIGQLKLQPSIIARTQDYVRPGWYNITRIDVALNWNPLYLNPFELVQSYNTTSTVQRQELGAIGGGVMSYRRFCDGQPGNINPDADGFDFFIGRFVE